MENNTRLKELYEKVKLLSLEIEGGAHPSCPS